MKIHYLQVLLAVSILSISGCARKDFFAPTPVVDTAVHERLKTQAPGTIDSVTVVAGKQYKRGWFHRLLWGQQYRNVWAAPVKVEVFNMKTTEGGLEIEKLGGGMQTTSFTLVDEDDFPFALRSVDKDPIGILPNFLQKTFVANVVRDQTSAINPYAAIVLPTLAASVAIPHSSPKLVYVLPTDKSFGEYNEKLKEQVFMIEEKYTDDRAITDELGDADDIVSSKKLLKKRFGKNSHFIDQPAFAKARLFDIFINDWDRHEGQWEWAEYKEDNETIYRPIPKDRDNAFFKMDSGLFPWLLTRKWAIRKFESFHKDYRDVKALTINSEFIDARALPEVTREQFQSIAKEMQASLTDAVLEEAVRQYPDSVYKLIGEETLRNLKNRRDKLHEAADEFYLLLAKEPLVVGTDDEEIFRVKRLNDEETEVTVLRSSDKKQLFHRVFKRSETKQIKLYGLAEDDTFEVSGEVDKGIKVMIVGGRGSDIIEDTSRVRSWGSRKTVVYDTKRSTEIEGGKETKDKTTMDVRVHAFDREGKQ